MLALRNFKYDVCEIESYGCVGILKGFRTIKDARIYKKHISSPKRNVFINKIGTYNMLSVK